MWSTSPLTSRGRLNVEIMDRDYAWLDTDTPDSTLDLMEFVRVLEKTARRQDHEPRGNRRPSGVYRRRGTGKGGRHALQGCLCALSEATPVSISLFLVLLLRLFNVNKDVSPTEIDR